METFVAIDIGGTKIAGALVGYGMPDEPPTVSPPRFVATDPARGGEAVLESAVRLVAGLVGESPTQLAGIGVGTAGVVSLVDGSILHASGSMPGWAGSPVKARLESEFGLPVAVLGDVQAHALGEVRWGAARGAESCLVVAVGTGIGGAFAIEGRVARGFHGAAAHLGQTCACGSFHDIESVASGLAIAARYGKGSPTTCEHVAKRANSGELEAIAVLEAAGRALGASIASWCNVLDPELVVLSGGVSNSGPIWRLAVDEGFKSRVIPLLADIPILHAALGRGSALIGAAEEARMRKDCR